MCVYFGEVVLCVFVGWCMCLKTCDNFCLFHLSSSGCKSPYVHDIILKSLPNIQNICELCYAEYIENRSVDPGGIAGFISCQIFGQNTMLCGALSAVLLFVSLH